MAVFGVVGYALLLAAALTSGDLGRFGGFTGALIGFGFSAYLTYLELFVINAICQWCVASAVLMARSCASTGRGRSATARWAPNSGRTPTSSALIARLGSALSVRHRWRAARSNGRG